ncbi:MAG: hypothetical protein ACJA0H_002053 [Francisellaceae bacterium]|jgi:hypothetical protein
MADSLVNLSEIDLIQIQKVTDMTSTDTKKRVYYSREDLIRMRVADEEIGARSIPFFGFLLGTVISAAILFGLLYTPPFGHGIPIVVMGISALLMVGSGGLTLIYGILYFAFLTTEKYRVSRKPASMYKKAVEGLSKDQLLEIHYEARRRIKIPIGVHIANNFNMPNTSGSGVNPPFNANTMFDQNSHKTMFD